MWLGLCPPQQQVLRISKPCLAVFLAAWTLWMLTLYQPYPLSCCPSGIQRETRPCWLPWTEGELTTLYQHFTYSLKDDTKTNRVKKTANFEKTKQKLWLLRHCCHSSSYTFRVTLALLVLLENKAGRDTMWVFEPSNALGVILYMKSPKKQVNFWPF